MGVAGTLGSLRLSHPEFFYFWLMEEVEDFSPSVERLTDNKNPTSYIWANCKRKGWQVLVPVENLKCARPEPPTSVLYPQTRAEKPAMPASEWPSTADCLTDQVTRQRQGVPVVPIGSTDVNSANSERAWKDTLNKSPRSLPPVTNENSNKDYISSNRLNISPPTRVTKSALLEQAAQQLRESEKIGETLAAKLKIIKKKIGTS